MDRDFWLPGEARRGRCLPPGYFWLRFGGGSGAGDWISPGAGLRNGTAALQLSFMTSKATAPKWGIKHGHVLEVLEQLTLCKYRARPVRRGGEGGDRCLGGRDREPGSSGGVRHVRAGCGAPDFALIGHATRWRRNSGVPGPHCCAYPHPCAALGQEPRAHVHAPHVPRAAHV